MADGEATARISSVRATARTSASSAATRTSSTTWLNRRAIDRDRRCEDGTVRVRQAATNGTVAVVRPSKCSDPESDARGGREARVIGKDAVRLYAREPCPPPARLKALAQRAARAGARLTDAKWRLPYQSAVAPVAGQLAA